MTLNVKNIQYYAEAALKEILKDTGVSYTAEVGRDTGALTLKLSKSVGIGGYSALIQFMFMKDGEVYFFALFDEIDLSAANAALAFEATSTTALGVTIDEFLTVELGAYLFNEADAGRMITRYFDDIIYLVDEDDSFKALLSKMKK